MEKENICAIIMGVNILMKEKMLIWLKEILIQSAINVDKELILKATDENSKIHPSSIYGITKQQQEQMILLMGKALRFLLLL